MQCTSIRPERRKFLIITFILKLLFYQRIEPDFSNEEINDFTRIYNKAIQKSFMDPITEKSICLRPEGKRYTTVNTSMPFLLRKMAFGLFSTLS
jgi:hypothetical protein